MKKFFTILYWMFFYSLGIWAVPATPYPIEYKQPDGSILTVYLKGDENKHYYTTEDKYLLLKDAQGTLRYAVKNTDGSFVSSHIDVNNIKKRTRQEKQFLRKNAVKQLNINNSSVISHSVKVTHETGYPLMGSPKSIVILVNFADKMYVTPHPQQAYTNLLNERGYTANNGTGSACDYFRACSYGQFTPDFVVVGPYTLPQKMSYYGENGSDDSDKRPQQMIVDACHAADAEVDFTIYDTDHDGCIDNVFVYYAGYNEAEGAAAATIWPHRWGIYPTSIYSGGNYTGSVESVTFDGVRVCDYACTSELRGRTGNTMCGIGTFCHEFGHVLGLPDYYHTQESKETLEYWDIMDSGSYLNGGSTPPIYNSFSRFFLGWMTPVEINRPADLSLLPVSQDTILPTQTQAFLISKTNHNMNGKNPNPKEFFILEHRKKTGWDSYLPDLDSSGLLIWHIDYSAMAWNNNMVNNYSGTIQTESSHMRVYLQSNDGSNTKNKGSAFVQGRFSPKLWNKTVLDRELTNITLQDNSIAFDFMGGRMLDAIAPTTEKATDITMVGFCAHWKNEQEKDLSELMSIYYFLSVFYMNGQDTVYVEKNKIVYGHSDVLFDLKPATTYMYYVESNLIKGNRWIKSEKSDIVTVKTLDDTRPNHLPLSVKQNDGISVLEIIKENTTETLYVYDVSGHLIMVDTTPANTLLLSLDQLQKGIVYIFKAGNRSTKWAYY